MTEAEEKTETHTNTSVRARRRFKALVRLVIQNLHWLDEIESLGQSVKKNVHLLVKKHKTSSLLSPTEKALLNKPADKRTDEEKVLLYRIIGGLKCFRRFPEHVKMALAGVTYFVYFGPNRVIVRENHYAHALYFIISGEVEVTVNVVDPVTKEQVPSLISTMGVGQTFGELSLLHDLPRNNTVTTLDHTEFLMIWRPDFDKVLKASIKSMWDQMLQSMDTLNYFEDWDDLTKKECCVIAKVTNYSRDETMFGDNIGLSNWVYFILKGSCRLIENLLVQVDYLWDGTKRYRHYTARDKAEEEYEILNRKSRFERLTSMAPEIRRSRTSLTDKSTDSVVSSTNVSNESVNSVRPSIPYPPTLTRGLPIGVEQHFMQVCIFLEKACFFGEPMVRRRVVAMEEVQCLLIPRYWLQLRSKAHVWVRINHYLHTHIPTTEAVFNEFIMERNWRSYKKDLITSAKPRIPCNNIHNVPYSIRINEDFDF